MSRLEKTTVREIGGSAQWVEHLLIEMGQLAQNMIHLEGEVRRDTQVRLAFEKAIKLSALAAHLVGALDHALDQGPALLRIGAEIPGENAGMPVVGAAGAAPAAVQPHRAAAAQTPPVPEPAGPVPAAGPSPRVTAATQLGLQRQAQAREPASADRFAGYDEANLSSLIQVSEPVASQDKNPMREMILALSRRGLSRSEIEVITEQPRHIIEAVLAAG
jgi:hypothetical protein